MKEGKALGVSQRGMSLLNTISGTNCLRGWRWLLSSVLPHPYSPRPWGNYKKKGKGKRRRRKRRKKALLTANKERVGPAHN